MDGGVRPVLVGLHQVDAGEELVGGVDALQVLPRYVHELGQAPPARGEEVEHAKEEGIIFKTLTNPTEILGYHNPDDPLPAAPLCIHAPFIAAVSKK